MNRIFISFFVLGSFLAKSQIIIDSVRPSNCLHEGAIFLDIFSSSQVDTWQFNDEDLGWINADTISAIHFSDDQDSLITEKCGSYRVVILGDTSNTFYIGCPLSSRASHLNVNCFGDSSGILKSIAYSGSSPYFYEWYLNNSLISSGYDDTIINNLFTGNYKFILTDSLGCLDSLYSIISSPTELLFDTTFCSNINCIDLNTGAISVTTIGGKQYLDGPHYDAYLIDFTSGDTLAILDRDTISLSISLSSIFQITFDSLFAGNYLLSVVDSLGCTVVDTFQLNQPLPYETFASTTFPLICESDSGFLMIDSILGGGNINYGFNYDSLIGVYEDSLYVPSGIYNIFIEDLDFGCIDTVDVVCSAQYEINVFAFITNINCFGDYSGSIIIDSIIGGNTPYDVQWGSVNNEYLNAGNYIVDIVDSIGCVHQEIFEVTQSNEILTNEVIIPSNCFGGSEGIITIDLIGGTNPLSYNWLNGTGNPDSLFGLYDGIYQLIVDDGLACIDTFSFSLQSPNLLEIELIADEIDLSCNGALTSTHVLITGGISPYLINWNDTDTSAQRVLGAGNYQVEILDNNGCSALQTLVITEPDSLRISVDYTNIGCITGASATINTSGGIPPISYLWSNGDTTSSIDSLWQLTYWVVATDSCGMSISDTFNLNYYELITNLNYNDTNYSATIEIESSNSTGPFEYSWINIFGDTISFNENSSSLCEGTYFAIITDISNNCNVIDTLLVEFDLPEGIFDILTTTVYDNFQLWGSQPYNYLWSNGEVTQKAIICTGSHWVEVTDVNNCLVRQDFTIDELIITLDPAASIIECSLENLDFDIEASASGGIEPYSFKWWNGFVGNPINLGLNPGDFTVIVTDGNNCNADTSFVIASLTSECIPNVFSPNGDNINDIWSLEDAFLFNDSRVRIYGRFGSLIFESEGYYNKWNGTNRNGVDVPEGVYFYSIDIGHGFDIINGTVTILR